MSFSTDIRSTGHFQEQFGKLRRRINKNELPVDDLQSMQMHVNNIRTQIDFARCNDITENIGDIQNGPFDFIFEPDITETKIYNFFEDYFGDGLKLDKTLNSIAYDVISIADATIAMPIAPDTLPTAYAYEPYGTYNGTTDFTSIADSAPLDLTQFSVACWFKTTGNYSTNSGMMVNKGGVGSEVAGSNMNYGLWFDIDAPSTVRGGFEESDGTDHMVTASTSYNDGQWHHAVVTYDGSIVILYIDGAQVGTHLTSATPETNTQPLVLGRNSRSSSRFFSGNLDEVYVWNNDLTSSEVLALYSPGTVPQAGNIVYSNTFGGSSGLTVITTKKCYYAVPDMQNSWSWAIGVHPPIFQNGWSISLNRNGASNQFIYYDNFGTDFDFTSQNFSMGFWFYPTDLSNTGTKRTLVARRIDASNKYAVEIDNSTNKLYMVMKVGGVATKRQYDTPLTTNTWYYFNATWETTPTLSIKVNNNADISSTLSEASVPSDTKIYFGSYPGATNTQDFNGYLAYPHYYKHSTVLTTAERTSLYNYGTRTNTTLPMFWGVSAFG